MRKAILGSCFVLVASAALATAQNSPQLLGDIPYMAADQGASCDTCCNRCCGQPRGWVEFDYLNWWITPGPVAVPLVTTGNPASPTAGALGDPSTVVLFGNSNINFGPLLGGRITAGYWFDCDATCGIEASGFLLARQVSNFSASSDGNGNPLLAIPFQTAAGAQNVLLISSPAVPQTGSVNVNATTQLWGAHCLAACNIYCDCTRWINLLGGFRYIDLNETLQISDNTSANPPPVTVPIGDFHTVTTAMLQQSGFDFFGTRNQFYGGEIGARAAYHKCCWSAEILGLLAMGANVQTLYTGGTSTTTTTVTQQLFSNGPPARLLRSNTVSTTTTTAGNAFLNPNNIGNFETTSFSVIPQIGVKIGYDITCHLRATVGYDVLYWDNVERPGNQISSIAGSGPQHNLSSVWVQGFDVGLGVHW